MTIDDEDLITPEIIAGFKSYLDYIEQRKNVPFNGVMGSMPEWTSQFHKDEFFRIRDNLLNDTREYDGELITEEKIIKWIDEYQMMDETDRQPNIPDALLGEIGRLYQYRHAVKLGEIEGLRFLAGNYAVMGLGYSKEQSLRAKVTRKLTEEHKINIIKIYTQAQKEGSVYGVVKALSARYNVSERQISNIVKDLIKK